MNAGMLQNPLRASPADSSRIDGSLGTIPTDSFFGDEVRLEHAAGSVDLDLRLFERCTPRLQIPPAVTEEPRWIGTKGEDLPQAEVLKLTSIGLTFFAAPMLLKEAVLLGSMHDYLGMLAVGGVAVFTAMHAFSMRWLKDTEAPLKGPALYGIAANLTSILYYASNATSNCYDNPKAGFLFAIAAGLNFAGLILHGRDVDSR